MRTLLRELAVALLFCLLTALMTWPLVSSIGDALPHPEDPMINTWILDWDLYALTHRDAGLFDANIFHPHRRTLAFSENLLGIALPLLPLYLAGVEPVALYNIAAFLGFLLTGYGAYVLARLVTGSTGAAIVSGIYFAFFTFRFTHLTHLQHLWALWLPLMLAALWWFAQKPSPRRAALLAFAFVMNGLTNLHWLAFGSVAIALSVLVLAKRDRRYWAGAAGALAIGTLALLPVLWPYKQVRDLYGMRGDRAETLQYSAEPRDWTISSVQSRWYATAEAERVHPERWLFPGGLVLLFAALGLFHPGRARLVALLWIALGFFGSLGLRGWFGTFLFEYVPLFKGIRAPARWSFIAYAGLALLAACGVAWLARRLGGKRGKVAVIAIAFAFVVELLPRPVPYIPIAPHPPVYAHLARHAGDGPVAHLPLAQGEQYELMLRATAHHRPMINGVSGFTPRLFAELRTMSERPSADFTRRLRDLGVTTLVVHHDRLGATRDATRAWLARSLAEGSLAFDARFGEDEVYTIRR